MKKIVAKTFGASSSKQERMSSSSEGSLDDGYAPSGDAQGSEMSGGPAGVLRSVLRTVVRRMASSNIGSFPHPQVIAKSSERLADLIDLSDHLQKKAKASATTPTKDDHSSMTKAKSSEPKAKNLLRRYNKKARFYGKVALAAAPEFIKSSILGTVLFGIYERFTSAESALFSYSVYNSILAGILGGLAHGSLAMTWDIARSKVPTNLPSSASVNQRLFVPATFPPSMIGLLSVHMIVHCTLFSTYEMGLLLSDSLAPRSIASVSDNGSTNSTITDNGNSDIGSVNIESRLVELVRVAVVGGIAGVVSETVSHYTEPIEMMGVREGAKMARRLGPPPRRLLGHAFLPSAIGFIAYEYGKESGE